ncbi:MAG TPA: iron-containing alcohol dehydrogenase [Caulobacteraceae bacterium]|nr:iron-containing alcohol dehydrogenase [Caulobacteraceae bacterium]
MTELRGNWNYPTSIRFGAGRIAELADACRAAGIARPLLVTDRGLAGAPMIAEAILAVRDAGLDIAVFSDIAGDPTGVNVTAGGQALIAHGADGVIAFGGGSALDAGKAVAFATHQDRPLWAFEDVGDNFRLADPARILPIIAVPTTAGTGSEVGRASVIKDEDARRKRIIFHPRMLPVIVIADPALTLGLPAALTAAVGMDALSHNLEAFFAPGYHPLARGIAVEGARLVRDWLPTAVRDGADIQARSHMLAAAEAGATAFQRGLGAMHALAHPLGALYGVHHGLLNAVLMPYVLEANMPAIEGEAAWLAGSLAVGGEAGDLVAWVLALRSEIGIPDTLADIGVPPGETARVARMAVQDPSAASNPITFSQADYAAILERAMAGEHAQPAQGRSRA